jgi:choline-sulfatase
MDLLPTLVALANGGDLSGVVGDLDGRSLVPLLTGESTDRDPVLAEYLAEGAIAPIVMVRQGDLKLVHSPADPDQLYHLSADPLERDNLVEDPAYVDRLAELKAEVASRWDLALLDRQVRESQQCRKAVVDALAHGAQPGWDFAPTYDAAGRYIRNHMDLGDLESVARFPRVRGVTATDP